MLKWCDHLETEEPGTITSRNVLQNRMSIFHITMTHFMLLVSFQTPWKHKKSPGFLMHSMQKVWAPFFYKHPPLTCPLFISVFQTPLFDDFFWQYCPDETQNKHKKNSWEKVINSYLQDNKTTLNRFLKQHLYKQHQSEIWLEIIKSFVCKGFNRNINIINERLAE